MSTGVELKLDTAKLVILCGLLSLLCLVTLPFAARAGLLALSNGSLAVSSWVLFLGFAGYLAASIARWFTSRWVDPQLGQFYGHVLNTLVLFAILFVFAVGGLRRYVPFSWFLAAAAFVALVQFGALAFDLVRSWAFMRLMDMSQLPPLNMFKEHSLTYVALPVGAVLGAIGGAGAGLSPQQVLGISLLLIIGLMALGVSFFLGKGVLRLGSSILMREEGDGPALVLFDDSFATVAAPADPSASAGSRVQALEAVCLAAELRKVVLTNQCQQFAVLVASLLALMHLGGLGEWLRWAAPCLVIGGLAVTQVPYVVGQHRAHAYFLGRLKGAARQRAKVELAEMSPLSPRLEAWSALTAGGGMGALAFALLERLLPQDLVP